MIFDDLAVFIFPILCYATLHISDSRWHVWNTLCLVISLLSTSPINILSGHDIFNTLQYIPTSRMFSGAYISSTGAYTFPQLQMTILNTLHRRSWHRKVLNDRHDKKFSHFSKDSSHLFYLIEYFLNHLSNNQGILCSLHNLSFYVNISQVFKLNLVRGNSLCYV